MKTDIHEMVTSQIIEAIENNNTLPWIAGFKSDNSAALTMPHNRVSKNNYTGVNVLLLWCAQMANSFTGNTWLTFKQATELGGNVRKGEKGTRIVFFKQVSKEKINSAGDTVKDSFGMLRKYTVFNVEQCENVEGLAPVVPVAPCDAFMLDVCASVGANVDIAGNQPCFIPSHDLIKMPHVDQYESANHFNADLAHELTHWTGEKSRLDRKFNYAEKHGKAMEELVAEIGAAFITTELGASITEMRHADYIASFLACLRDDKRAIFKAASAAQKAHNYIKELAALEMAA